MSDGVARRASAPAALRVFGAAVMFLTRIPVPRALGYDPDDLARSTVWFPVVGLLVGGAGALALWAALHLWPPLVAAALSTAATAWLTGAFHEDALADSFDGFGGGYDRERILAIMKDSRVGSYALVGVALALLAKVGALATLAERDVGAAARALVAAHVLGRWSSLPLIRWLPYVREDGAKSRPFAASVTTARLLVGSVLALALVAAALQPSGVAPLAAVLLAAVVVTALGARYFRRTLGGMTGDCLGAANQMVELVTYLVLAARWGAP